VTPIARRRVRFEFVVDGVVDRKGLGRVGHRDRVGRTVHRIVDRAIVVVVETAAAVADEEDNYHFREAYSWEVRPFEMGVAVALDVRVDVVQEVEIVDDEDLLVALEVGRNPVSWDIVVVADLALVVMDEGALEIVVVVAAAAAAAAAGVDVVGKEEAAGAAIPVDPVVREIAPASADSLAFAFVVAVAVHAEVLHGSPETIQEVAFADEAFGPVGPASWVDRVVVAAQPRPIPFLRSRVVFPPHDFAAVAAFDCVVVAALHLADVPGFVDHCYSIDHL